jgi:plastocyanin
MKRWNFVAAMLGAAMMAACGGGGAGGDSTGPTTTPPVTGGGNPNVVTMQGQTFTPGALTVAKGSTVTWTWPACDNSYGYGTCVSHSVVFDDGSGTASPEQSSGSFARTFATAGTFNYHCGVHGMAMNGQIVVQ